MLPNLGALGLGPPTGPMAQYGIPTYPGDEDDDRETNPSASKQRRGEAGQSLPGLVVYKPEADNPIDPITQQPFVPGQMVYKTPEDAINYDPYALYTLWSMNRAEGKPTVDTTNKKVLPESEFKGLSKWVQAHPKPESPPATPFDAAKYVFQNPRNADGTEHVQRPQPQEHDVQDWLVYPPPLVPHEVLPPPGWARMRDRLSGSGYEFRRPFLEDVRITWSTMWRAPRDTWRAWTSRRVLGYDPRAPAAPVFSGSNSTLFRIIMEIDPQRGGGHGLFADLVGVEHRNSRRPPAPDSRRMKLFRAFFPGVLPDERTLASLVAKPDVDIALLDSEGMRWKIVISLPVSFVRLLVLRSLAIAAGWQDPLPKALERGNDHLPRGPEAPNLHQPASTEALNRPLDWGMTDPEAPPDYYTFQRALVAIIESLARILQYSEGYGGPEGRPGRRPDEFVLVTDGGSRDGPQARAEKLVSQWAAEWEVNNHDYNLGAERINTYTRYTDVPVYYWVQG